MIGNFQARGTYPTPYHRGLTIPVFSLELRFLLSQQSAMLDHNDALKMQHGALSTTPASDDRLSLLPKGLLDTIFSLISHALNTYPSPYIRGQSKQPSPHWRHAGDRDRLHSISALP